MTTLATDRALLLLGVPGTAKTWVSEHLAAAVSGDSTLLVQGTAGTPEEAIRYGWNYAQLLAHGPSRDALVPSPVMRAMSEGMTARVEELTRIPADVQDTLITILSEKTLPIAELGQEVQAVRGFNLIATANDRDRGVNELSSALRRRFNTVVLPLPESVEAEVDIVSRRVDQLWRSLDLHTAPDGIAEIRRYSGCTVLEGRCRLNRSYLDSGYSTTNRKHVACQEVGHLFGLGHNRGSSTTCMNDTILSAPQPNSHDQSLVNSIY